MHSPKNRRGACENEGQEGRFALPDMEHILELWQLEQWSLGTGTDK